ncbi:Putative serine/threonine-protein kinase, active [Septoria linicola]|uniref:non-specific serine/threonine protein kinase n=1 Tax=Septoria linicola TaxID=215465 RepID=A0A9Q9AM85_9PEZI|nr:Putative serine/threonine-protein kinase, active [Septoria linicola]
MATTTKFGFRQWGSHGDLRCEYWISDIDLAGTSSRHPVGESSIHFTAGNLQSIHNYKLAPYNTPRSNSHHSHSNHDRHLKDNRNFDFEPSINRLKSAGAQSTAKSQGWRFFTRKERHDSFQPSDSQSTSSDNTSNNSMTTDVKTRTMPSTPATEKRKSGLLGRLHLGGHHRRRSSLNGVAQTPDVISSANSSRPPTAVRQTTQPPATPQSTDNALQVPTANGTSTTQDAPPQIMIRAPTARDEFEGVHYPDGLSPSPTPLSPGARSNRGIKWAENYDEAPPRPRRTSSAATHGRRSSIYSKDVDGNFDNVLGVEAGVGSKARRLSVALPDDLQVDECKLEEHFSYIERKRHREIGQGGAAIVRLMTSKTAGDSNDKGVVFAVKEFRLRDAAEETEFEYERKIKSEFAISKACDNTNIVKTFRLCHSGEQWYHVMEYCELGDLNDLIQSGNFTKPEDRNCMFKQLVRGVHYLHSRGIAHRDLKSENLLVNKAGLLKIADFGTGEVFCGQHPGVRHCRRQSIVDANAPIRYCDPGWVGSVPYMAPEIYQRRGKYDPRAVDVWAVAIVYITLCFNGNCWDFAGPECKNFRIFLQYWDRWFEQCEDHEIRDGRKVPQFAYIGNMARLDDPETRVMLMGMLHPEPSKRWTITQVLESKPVEQAECCQQEGYSDDIKTRQKKARHNHIPMDKRKKLKP